MGWEGQKDGFAEIKPEIHMGAYSSVSIIIAKRLFPPVRLEEKAKVGFDASPSESMSETVDLTPDGSPSETISESVQVTSP